VRQLHHGGHVDVELGLECLEVGGPELARSAESRVVHQDSDTGGEPVGHLGAIGGDGQVGGQHLHRSACFVVQFGGKPVEAVDVTGHQDQVMTVDGVAVGESRAQAGRRSGDHCDGA
jgi:hypothetical protein